MSAAENSAVFLSYAREDAAAARRLAEALRAHDIEVWFDEDELRGGDSWDAKIRKQIKECALFVPVISAHTQSRPEGYFRLEWKLADRRTDLIGKSKAFLLPVCIDDTAESAADVPDSFLAVQWTRLPNGDAPAQFCARVEALLILKESRHGLNTPASGDGRLPPAANKKNALSQWAAVAAVVAVVAGAAVVWRPWRASEGAKLGETSAARGRTEAQQLVSKARAIFNEGEEAQHENFFFAEEFLKQAVTLEVANAEAWAAYGQLSVDMYRFGFDRSAARIEAMRSQIDRAIRLDPDSIEAHIAQASAADYLGLDQNVAEASLRRLVQRAPNNRFVLQALVRKLGRSGKVDEAIANADRAAALTSDNSSAWDDVAPYALAAGRYDEAEAVVAKSLARRTSGRALAIDTLLKLGWRGDHAAATAAVARWPGWFLLEDRGGAIAGLAALWSREPAKALLIYLRVPRDYLRDTYFTGPRAALTAFAHEQAGHPEAARADWQLALQVAEREAAAGPSDGYPLYWRAWALAQLGDRTAAEVLWSQIEQRNWLPTSYYSPDGGLPGLALALGDTERAIVALQRALAPRAQSQPLFKNFYLNYSLPRGVLELNPVFDPLRGDERFKRLVAKAPAPARAASNLVAVAPKSIAVLAFENRSSEKDSEYFSDGISEELLNVLAKVPGLRVVGRASSFQFKGKHEAPAKIAKELNVTHLITGSVQRVGTRARITAELTLAATGEALWSDKLDTELKDIFAAQDEIAGLIAERLSLKLGTTMRTGAVVNPEAHRLVLEARSYWARRDEAAYAQAEQLLAQALKIAPDFARAHATLATVLYTRLHMREVEGLRDRNGDKPRARAAALRALELDQTLDHAQALLGYELLLEGKFAEADLRLRRAIEINPNSAGAYRLLGELRSCEGRLEVAIDARARAEQLDPLDAINLVNFAQISMQARQFTQALELHERFAKLRTEIFIPHLGQHARTLQELGRKSEAVAVARTIRAHPEADPRWQADSLAISVLRANGLEQEATAHGAEMLQRLPADSYQRGFVLSALGRFEEALPFLGRTPITPARWMYWDPIWDPWRNDPRFEAVLTKLGLLAEYRVARETLTRMLTQRKAQNK